MLNFLNNSTFASFSLLELKELKGVIAPLRS